MNLQLEKRKFRAKQIASTIFTLVPAGIVVNFLMQYRECKKYLSSPRIDYDAINQAISTLPKDAHAYYNFSAINSDLTQLYNEALASVKANNDISDSLVNQYNCSTDQEFMDTLNTLYVQGKAGDLEAQTQFTSMMLDYTNNFYEQAYEIASVNYTNLITSQAYIPDFDLSVMNVLTNMDVKEMAVGIVSVGILVFGAISMYDHFFGYAYKRMKHKIENVKAVDLEVKK